MKDNDINKLLQINFIACVIFVLGSLLIPFIKSDYYASSVFIENELFPVMLVIFIFVENILFTGLFIYLKNNFAAFRWRDAFLLAFLLLVSAITYILRQGNLFFIIYMIILTGITLLYVTYNVEKATKHIATYESRGPMVLGYGNIIRLILIVGSRLLWYYVIKENFEIVFFSNDILDITYIIVTGVLIYFTYELYKHKIVDNIYMANAKYLVIYIYFFAIAFVMYNILFIDNLTTQFITFALNIVCIGVAIFVDTACEVKLNEKLEQDSNPIEDVAISELNEQQEL